MVLTYLVVATLLVLGLVWLGRHVDAGRRSVDRYHKAMDVLAEINHEPAPPTKSTSVHDKDSVPHAKAQAAHTKAPGASTRAARSSAKPVPATNTTARFPARGRSHTAPPAAEKRKEHSYSHAIGRAKLAGIPRAFAMGRPGGAEGSERTTVPPDADTDPHVIPSRQAPNGTEPATRRPGPARRMVFVDDDAASPPVAAAVARVRTPNRTSSELGPAARAPQGGARQPWTRSATNRLAGAFARPRGAMVGGVAALVAALTVLAVVASAGPGGHAAHRHAAGATRTTISAPTQSSQPAPSPSTSSPTTTASPAAPSPGGAPVLSAISPSVGQQGQTIAIQGTGLMSADGLIVVLFGPEEASTSCPSQLGCVVTVPPPPPGQPSVPVQVKTAAGVSNALTFHYTPAAGAAAA